MSVNIFSPKQLLHRNQGLFHTLNHKLNTQEFKLEEIGDYIPGSVMIQNLTATKNLYMNTSGCEILRHSQQELAAMGTQYFQLFFPPEEMLLLKNNLVSFIRLNDKGSTTSFFQRVRSGINQDYKWYLTTSRLCVANDEARTTNIMHVSMEAGSLYHAQNKLSSLIEEELFVRNNYMKFCSLTQREKEIVKLISEGITCSQISDMLFISLHTVHNHRKNINKKLEITSVSQLIRFAIEFKLII